MALLIYGVAPAFQVEEEGFQGEEVEETRLGDLDEVTLSEERHNEIDEIMTALRWLVDKTLS